MVRYTKGGFRRAGKVIFPREEGSNISRVFEPDPWAGDPDIGVTTYTKEIWRGGRKYGQVYSYKSRLIRNENGMPVGVKNISGKVPEFMGEVYYRSGGKGRLNKGFDTLISKFKWAGIPNGKLNKLKELWDSLNDTQKALAWDYYRNSDTVLTHGSFMSVFSDGMGEPEDYYDALEDAITKALYG